MVIKGLLLIACLGASFSVNAADVYGVNREDAKKIIKKYGQQINRLEAGITKEASRYKAGVEEQPHDSLIKRKQAIIDGLIKDYGLLFADLQAIYYPEYKKFFITVEVVDKDHPQRLRFVNLVPKQDRSNKKEQHQPDVIDHMAKYVDIGQELMISKTFKIPEKCPVLHCSVGFEAPRLKPFLAEFNEGAVKDRSLILKTLKQDPDPNRRGAAIFLMGHFKDPKEVVSTLTPYVADKDDLIRNNAMRVIAETVYHAHLPISDVSPFVEVLESPYATDRNKAMYVLNNVVKTDDVKKQILVKGGDNLVEILRLKQPDNHYPAYQLLKSISGKDFGSTNVAAWSRWVSSAKKRLG